MKPVGTPSNSMPGRIYAKIHGATTDVISGQRGLIGGWNEHKREGQIEYVRSDTLTRQGATVMASELTLEQIISRVMRDHIGPEHNQPIGEGGAPRIDWYALQAELLSAISAWNTRTAPVDANSIASNPVDDKIALDTDGNAPAATDTELVTVHTQVRFGPDDIWRNEVFIGERSRITERRELVTRSQADELLAVWAKKVAEQAAIIELLRNRLITSRGSHV
ncbi:hypothetical protein [Brucella sp. 191011898]|uniref:hypothetical protein n=1 Tax=Brucella sp. 191011898 TaxID=2730447 RepID=UPI0015E01A3C|nr:hypothetical protein [Brucella sp. 191011898]CAB4326583.1 hypothetical protein BCH_01929 [Brucella sp. 191011898]